MLLYTSRRRIPVGAPISTDDVRRPVVVKKNSPVTLVLSTPNMMLTAQGRAMEDGAVGDVIRVSNEHSRITVSGMVLPSGEIAAGMTTTTSQYPPKSW